MPFFSSKILSCKVQNKQPPKASQTRSSFTTTLETAKRHNPQRLLDNSPEDATQVYPAHGWPGSPWLRRHLRNRRSLVYPFGQRKHLHVRLTPISPLLSKSCSPKKEYHTNTPYSLSYETDINGVPNIETDNPSSGRVIIYSPSCIAWGQAVITSNNPTSIMAFGLSAKNPLLFVPVYTSAIGYPVPKYEYDGKVYGYSNCDCQFDTSTQGHDCICRFECVPFELDSKDVIGVNETAWGDAGE
jgi:hypothetical protein